MAHIDMEQIAKLNGQIAMDLKVERDTLRAAAQQALEALTKAQKYAHNYGIYLDGVPQVIPVLTAALKGTT